MRWLLKAAGLPLALVPSVALPLLLVAAAEDRGSAQAVEEAYRALPELPSAAPAESVEDLEQAAVRLAASLRAVPLGEGGEETCAADKLAVSWTEPGDAYEWGAHLDPVGPAPTADTKAVNGVVVCQGSEYSFMGFEAWRTDGDWELAAVPYVHEEHEEHDAPVPDAPKPAAPAPAVPAVPAVPVPAPLSLDLPAGAIEGYAAYEPQRLCNPTPKPGTLALRNLLLGNNPGTRNLGISRSCGAGGQSEHKEGRALDWGVLVSRANERAAAERFIGQLMATDAQGNRHAMARRMGVMYVIWNRQIWSAYRASTGWRPYGGASPHTDHVHISLSWAGAQGRTSFWSGKVDPSTLLAFQPPMPSGGGGQPAVPVSHTGPRRSTLPVGTLPTEAVEEALRERRKRSKDGRKRWEEREESHVADRRRRWEELSAEEQAAFLAAREAERAKRAEAEQEWRAERERRRAERQAQGGDGDGGDRGDRGNHYGWDDQRAERHALREAERAKRHADEQRRQAEEAARQAAEAAQPQPAAGAAAPAPEAPRDNRGGGGHRGDGAAIREAQRQAEAQRHAERQQQREAQRQAEAQRHAERQQQREAQKQAERQRRAEVERQRGRQRQAEAGQRRRRGGGEAGQAAAQGQGQGQGGGGGEHRGGRGRGHGRR